ncbi:MAG: hypothetical protein CMJ62_08490 [Planctomycetaceae bacterium]|nr:hypothetical protein [Planctomycetaceae bacterium]
MRPFVLSLLMRKSEFLKPRNPINSPAQGVRLYPVGEKPFSSKVLASRYTNALLQQLVIGLIVVTDKV